MFGDKKPASSGNTVIDQRAAVGPDNNIINAGISSGLPEYNLSDEVNNQVQTADDEFAAGGKVTPFTDSDRGRLFQTRQERLLQLRAMNPFVPIVMFPLSAKAAFLAANVPQDIPIPSGAKYVILRGTADYWVSVQGAAQVPTASIGLQDDGVAAILRPDGVLFYCEEMTSLSVVAAGPAIVSAAFYAQQ